MLSLDRRLSISIFNGFLNYPEIGQRTVLGFHELLHCWGMGWFIVKVGTGDDTVLPCAVRLLSLAASVDIERRVFNSQNLVRGCVKNF